MLIWTKFRNNFFNWGLYSAGGAQDSAHTTQLFGTANPRASILHSVTINKHCTCTWDT